jgi:RHH-type rel operon transcriptional repressor/antitoxin RelB
VIIRRGTNIRRAELSTHSVLNMSSTTISVRLDPVIKKRLEKLANSTGRSRSFLAAEAINEYLDLNEWQVGSIQKAVASLDRGEGISHERVKEWVGSWNSKKK